MNSNNFSNRRGRRVLICVRGNCAHPYQGKALEKQLNHLIEQQGLDDPDHPHHTTCTITNCLGICEDGPIMMVHPDGVRYHRLDETALNRIFSQHFLQDQPVAEHIQHKQPTISALRYGKRRHKRRRKSRY
jgi:(2Fe-2S) ferredoxin